jgi:hypothetical protein
MQKKVFLMFTGPAVIKGEISCEDAVLALTKFAEQVFGWQTVASHCVPLIATVQTGDKTK